MNAMGQFFRIGEYAHWWQVLTCYGFYLIPASLLVRHRSYFDQYLSGLLIIAILELPAYSLGTSIAHPNSILDQYLTPRNYYTFYDRFFRRLHPPGELGGHEHPALVREVNKHGEHFHSKPDGNKYFSFPYSML